MKTYRILSALLLASLIKRFACMGGNTPRKLYIFQNQKQLRNSTMRLELHVNSPICLVSQVLTIKNDTAAGVVVIQIDCFKIR